MTMYTYTYIIQPLNLELGQQQNPTCTNSFEKKKNTQNEYQQVPYRSLREERVMKLLQ